MKYSSLFPLLICGIVMFCCLMCGQPSTIAENETAIIIIEIKPTPTPNAPTLTPPPTPTPRPELPAYTYDEADMRCLSRAIWSITPKNPTRNTKLALCEVIQNRVDDDNGVYKDDVRQVLLQRGEFLDYDPEAYRSEENDRIADYAMRSWMAARLGDRSYRLTPASGVMCSFYRVKRLDYIMVYDKDGNVVYDSGR